MQLSDLIRRRPDHQIVTTTPETTVRDALTEMCEHRFGALPVMRDGVLVGIISERDILRAVCERRDIDQLRVADLMTEKLIIAFPHHRLNTIMNIMTRHKVRHLPVLDQEKLVGFISIGDIIDALREEKEEEVHFLHNYIAGA